MVRCDVTKIGVQWVVYISTKFQQNIEKKKTKTNVDSHLTPYSVPKLSI